MHDDHDTHGHDGCGHSHVDARSRKLKWVFLLTVAYMAAEIIGGLATGSLALLADAGHMAVDAVAIAIALIAARLAERAATERKTFGYYRFETLAAFVNAVSLIAVSASILYESAERWLEPVPIESSGMIAVAIGGLAVNIFSLRLLHGDHNHDLNSRGAWLHIIGDLLGSIGAIAAGLLIIVTGRTEFDAAISVVIAAIIVASSLDLVSNSVNVLLNGVPRSIDLKRIEQHLLADPEILEIHDLHVWAIDSHRTALTCHVVHKQDGDPNALLERLLRSFADEHGISHCTLQLEKAATNICGANAGCYSAAAA